MESSFKIAENINKVRTEIQWQFWEKLFKVFKNEGEIFEKISKNIIQKYYSENKNYYGFVCLIISKIIFRIQLDDTIYFSFNRKKGDNSTETKQILEIIKNLGYRKNKYNDGWRNIVPDINFKTNIQCLADDKKMYETVERIAKEAIKDIENMREKLEELDN